jgi:hypothetical protein
VNETTVSVELFRHIDGGIEGQLAIMHDSPELVVGAEVLEEGDAVPWVVSSVHRCEEIPGGGLDHSKCFV